MSENITRSLKNAFENVYPTQSIACDYPGADTRQLAVKMELYWCDNAIGHAMVELENTMAQIQNAEDDSYGATSEFIRRLEFLERLNKTLRTLAETRENLVAFEQSKAVRR